MATYTRKEYYSQTGSILANSTAATQVSGVSTSFQGFVDYVGISGPNTGSTYFLSINDSDGFKLISNAQQTGNLSVLTGIPVSGTVVILISGAQVGSPSFYHWKMVYS